LLKERKKGRILAEKKKRKRGGKGSWQPVQLDVQLVGCVPETLASSPVNNSRPCRLKKVPARSARREY
jgi:hypothetical protein